MKKLELVWCCQDCRWLRDRFASGRQWDPSRGVLEGERIQWDPNHVVVVDGTLLLISEGDVVGVCRILSDEQEVVDWDKAPAWANVLLKSTDSPTERVWAAAFQDGARARPAEGSVGPSYIRLLPGHRWEVVATRPSRWEAAPSSAAQEAPKGPFWIASMPSMKTYSTEQEALLAASRAAEDNIGREFLVCSVHKTVKCEVQIK